jgi:hypothetical protein
MRNFDLNFHEGFTGGSRREAFYEASTADYLPEPL